MRTCFALVTLVLFVPTLAVAQAGYYPLPNQLSLGVGIVGDRQPRQNSSIGSLSFAFADSGDNNDYWPFRLGGVWEVEFGATSDLGPCQAHDAQSGNPPHCEDAALLLGPRWYFFRRSARRVLPFADFMFGSYWKGSGVKDRDFASNHFALQAGGGIELRRMESIHGLKLCLRFRRISATDAPRTQIRFDAAYVVGCPCS
jgi:hypothetical protein